MSLFCCVGANCDAILAMICFPLSTHLPATRREQLVAVDGVLDRPLQPADLRLVGGNLRRLRRRLLLKLLILRLECVVIALPEPGAAGQEERRHSGNSMSTAFQPIGHEV